jgi:inner membrane protein
MMQAALGAMIGEWILGKYLGKQAMLWGALLALSPDLDGLFTAPFNHKIQLLLCDGLTHCLLFIAAISFGIARGFQKFWLRKKVTFARAASFTACCVTSHIFLQSLTVEGVVFLWPISPARLALNLVQLPDYLLALPLIGMAAWQLFRKPQKPAKPSKSKRSAGPKPRNIAYWGLGFAAVYLLMCCGMKALVSAGFDADLKRRGTIFSRRMEAPAAFSCLLWRAVVDRGGEFWVGYRSPFEATAAPVRWTIYPQGKSALAGLENRSEIRTLSQFSRGWWLARASASGLWFGDLCHGENRRWGDKKTMVDSRLNYAWQFNPTAKGESLQAIIAEPNAADFLKRAAQKISHQDDAWEANPRLAGVPGSLPEFLPVAP